MSQLYLITDSQLLPGEQLYYGVEAALRGGCRLVQYRDKSEDTAKRLRDARRLLTLCNQYHAKLIINDDVQLANSIVAAGVHLGQTDGDVRAARQLLGDEAIIGVTCHDSLHLAAQAVADGASYIAFGRFFVSNTKPDARPAPLSLLGDAKQKFPRQTLAAIGGITLDKISLIQQSGADLIAVCHDVFAADDIAARTQLFIQTLQANNAVQTQE